MTFGHCGFRWTFQFNWHKFLVRDYDSEQTWTRRHTWANTELSGFRQYPQWGFDITSPVISLCCAHVLISCFEAWSALMFSLYLVPKMSIYVTTLFFKHNLSTEQPNNREPICTLFKDSLLYGMYSFCKWKHVSNAVDGKITGLPWPTVTTQHCQKSWEGRGGGGSEAARGVTEQRKWRAREDFKEYTNAVWNES